LLSTVCFPVLESSDLVISSYAANPSIPLKSECNSRDQAGFQGCVDIFTHTPLELLLISSVPIQTRPRGFLATGAQIVQRETPLALYKGLGAVLSGIVPKMAIRFASFEAYKGWLADEETGKTSVGNIFIGTLALPLPLPISHLLRLLNDRSSAGLGAGTTEAVAVVCPMEVVKIRLQAQQHSLADPLEVPQYRNAGHAVYKIVREEGISALYRGVSLTALRQATNQGTFRLSSSICRLCKPARYSSVTQV
jgi:Mitochondrial carrier protein